MEAELRKLLSTPSRSMPRSALARSRLSILRVPLSPTTEGARTNPMQQGRFAERFFKKAAARNAGGWNLIKVRPSPHLSSARHRLPRTGRPKITPRTSRSKRANIPGRRRTSPSLSSAPSGASSSSPGPGFVPSFSPALRESELMVRIGREGRGPDHSGHHDDRPPSLAVRAEQPCEGRQVVLLTSCAVELACSSCSLREINFSTFRSCATSFLAFGFESDDSPGSSSAQGCRTTTSGRARSCGGEEAVVEERGGSF